MKTAIGWLIGLVFVVSVSAEPLLEGRVRLESGEPVADAQVRIFDLSDLRQGAIARAMTNGGGYFALPLGALTGRALPERFALGPNYPNPFNPSTIIPYQLAASAAVRLEVFNLLGQHIATLVDGERPAGFHTATWHAVDGVGRAVGAGVYIYRMTVGMESQTGRMVLLDGQAGLVAVGAASVMPGAAGIGGSEGEGAQVYGLVVSGSGLVPYVDSSFRVESGMAPVELVVSSGSHSAGKVTDDDCAFCDFFGGFDDQQEEEEYETPEEEGTDEQVVIPDANLRAVIETALDKASGAPITVAEMARLDTIRAGFMGISDLTGLGFAANLGYLDLSANNITDVSELASLANLTLLWLGANSIADISPLLGLTSLTDLRLGFNNMSYIPPLAGLINLEILYLDANNITDVSGLVGLTNLRVLCLEGTNITDISPLSGLTSLVLLWLGGNNIADVSWLVGLDLWGGLDLRACPLSDSSINDHIPVLERTGPVLWDSWLVDGDFDIEIVFLVPVTEAQKRIYRWVARRWMAVIVEDLPDYVFTEGWSGECEGYSYEIPPGERIDDLRMYVATFEGWPGYYARGGPTVLREETHLPVVGCMSSRSLNFLNNGLHETGHVLGFGTIWSHFGLLQNLSFDDPNADTHFNGPLAVAAFDDAGGRDYTGKKVPVAKMDGAHWRSGVFWREVMGLGGGDLLSAITVQSMAHLGYGVDVSQADFSYGILDLRWASAKIAAAKPSTPGVGVIQADALSLPGADPHWQGSIPGLPLLSGDDGLRGSLESAEWIGGRGFDLRDDRLMGSLVPFPRPVPKLPCGAGLRREPIYVIDPQGRIIRTLGD